MALVHKQVTRTIKRREIMDSDSSGKIKSSSDSTKLRMESAHGTMGSHNLRADTRLI